MRPFPMENCFLCIFAALWENGGFGQGVPGNYWKGILHTLHHRNLGPEKQLEIIQFVFPISNIWTYHWMTITDSLAAILHLLNQATLPTGSFSQGKLQSAPVILGPSPLQQACPFQIQILHNWQVGFSSALWILEHRWGHGTCPNPSHHPINLQEEETAFTLCNRRFSPPFQSLIMLPMVQCLDIPNPPELKGLSTFRLLVTMFSSLLISQGNLPQLTFYKLAFCCRT